MQFKLRSLFAATTIAGVSTYALIYASPFWAAVSFTLCIGLLLTAIVFTMAASGQSRFFWLGFAIFGCGYWLVLTSPITAMGPTAQNWRLNPEAGPPLITTKYLIWIYNTVLPLVHEEPQAPVASSAIPATSGSPQINPQPPRDAFGYQAWRYTYPADPEFMRVGHSLCALLFALLGGAIGSFAHWRYRRDH